MTAEAPPNPQLNGAPPAASAHGLMRASLPSVYRVPADGFAMRFVGALEKDLDPIVAILDLLPAHLDRAIAPPELVALLGDWFGLDLDPALSPEAHRRIVRRADELTRMRGTKKGLELLLELAFDDLDIEVRDSGSVTAGSDPTALDPAGEPVLTVVCPAGLDPDRRATIRRVVEEVKPAYVRLDLRQEGEPPDVRHEEEAA